MDSVFFGGILFLSLVKATPIALGAMSGLMCERTAVINIAIEGMMLVGAQVAFLGSVFFDKLTGGGLPPAASLMFGLLAAMLGAGLIALLHAHLCIHYQVDQIISGTVINLLAVGITNFTANAFIDPNGIAGVGVLPVIPIPVLSKIPVIGHVLFEHQPIVYVMLILVVLLQYALFNTPWGLHTMAVGEHPRAADTVGIDVYRQRYINVTLGGAIAGIGGAFLVIESVGRFQKLMTTGRGFIALAALIFGKWTSVGALGSALLFGFADALGVRLQLGDVNELQSLTLLAGLGMVLLALAFLVLKLVRRGDKRPWITIGAVGAVGLVLVGVAQLVSWPSIRIPVQFLGLLPYIATVLVLAGFVGRAIPPAADGQPYVKN